jgi:UDP-2-acetamido-2-deoxy-ribo-hexuluronate aminotransferase
MKEIKMADLQSQYIKIKEEIDLSISRVLESTAFIKGPEVKQFEDKLAQYLNCKHVVACANGTDALQIALMALDLKAGDEVIVPDFTFIATLEVVVLLGLKPVIADVLPDTFTIDIKSAEKKISKKTKAIIPVHLFGQNANMDSLNKLAEKYNLTIIEDAAQSLGSDYTYSNGTTLKSGTLGHIGCSSFFPSKNLGCFGDGGALFTDNYELASKIRCIANHGMHVRYYHEMVGVNSRLDTLQAAILQVKLNYLNQYNEARQKAAAFYDKELGNIKSLVTPYRQKNSTHIFHQYTLRVLNNKRDALKKFLEIKKIPTMIYYPVPLHLQKAFVNLGYKEGDFPITEQLSKEVISLPMHTEFEQDQLDYIVQSIIEFFH